MDFQHRRIFAKGCCGMALLALGLSQIACDGKAADAKLTAEGRMASLENKVSLLDLRLQMAEAKLKAPVATQGASAGAPAYGFELVVTWPSKGGNDYRRGYATSEACERARQAIFADDARRVAESHAAHERERAESGRDIIYGSEPPGANAVCVPQ